MQTILQLTRSFKRTIQLLCLMVFCLFVSNKVHAQPTPAEVVVTVNIQPPYSPYYSDYSGANAGKVFLIVRNLTNTQKSIKLKGQLTGNNGISITTKSTYVPLQPIILLPNQTKQLNGTALKDIFDLNSLNVYGVDKVKLVQTSRLPEGNYDFCIQAVDMNTNKSISDNGCTRFDISYPNAPVLISPAAFEKVNALVPQNILFNWINAGTVPLNTQYIIQVAQMPDIPADPNQVLNATTLPLLNQRIIGTSYRYGIGNVPLVVGKKYAWRAIASDPSGKTGFMNDGKSQAHVFVYGNTAQLAFVNPPGAIPDLLNIITPVCKNGNGTVVIGPNSNLSFSWLWKDQIESTRLFGTLDTNLLKHYTLVNKQTIKSYSIQIIRQGGYAGKSSVTLNVNAPAQMLNLTKQQVDELGLVTRQSYKLIVTALSESGAQISKAESCSWLLINEAPSAIPKLTIAGKLNYTFDKTRYFGANKATITLQILKTVDAKLDKGLMVMDNGKLTVQPVAYASTDADGNFTTQIEQLSSDTGARYLAITVNSGYYQTPASNLPINLPKIATLSDGKIIKRLQDTLVIKDINLNVFNQTVTVKLFKEFGADYSGTFKDASGKDVHSNYSVDQSMINSKSKVGAGVLVGIYRKVKSEFIPKYEGDYDLKNPQIRLQEGYTLVGEAKSIVKDGQAQVVFDRLLFRYADQDEYYIKAMLPKADPNNKLQTGNEEDLEAPEKWMASSMGMSTAVKINYASTVNYTMVSKKPPTARIKGKIMQQWPSAPGVLYPYANKSITVKMISQNSFAEGQVITNDNCQTYPSAVRQKITGADGIDRYMNLPGTGNNFERIVATGLTDKDGNYDLPIFDFVEMKNYDVELVATSNIPVGKTCAEIEAEKKAKEEADRKALEKKLEDQSKTGSSFFLDKGDGVSKMLEKQIEDMRKATGNGVLTGESAGADIGHGGLDIITIGVGAAGGSLIDKYGIGTGGGSIKPGPSPQGNVNLQIQQFAPPSKIKVSLGNFMSMNFGHPDDFVTQLSGPSAITEDENINLNPQPFAVKGTLSRFFTIEGIHPVSTINNDNGNTAARFVVQPFGSIDLGISVIEIEEVRNLKVEVTAKIASVVSNSNGKWWNVNDGPDNKIFDGAKLVVFRSDKKRPAAGIIPPGEGSPTHPVKKLINSTYNDNTPKYISMSKSQVSSWYDAPAEATGYNGEVEWVLDETISPVPKAPNKATFDLSNKRLWAKGEYMALITPDPNGNGGRFDPIVVHLSGDNRVITPNAIVSPSRISGRVIDNSSGAAIPGAAVSLRIYDSKSTQNNIISKPVKTLKADNNGYFQITNGADGFTWTDGDHYSIAAAPLGYGNQPFDKLTSINQVNYLRILQANGKNYEEIIKKTYGGKVKGIVMGEAAPGSWPKVIEAYIVREDGYLILSEQPKNGPAVANYTTGLPVMAGKVQKLKVIPVDPAYITEEVTVNAIQDGGILTKNITLKRRMHRMTFDITTTDGQKIPNADLKVTINNDVNNEDGTVLSKFTLDSKAVFKFENVSVNNYTIQISDANGKGYIPKIFSITNEEGDTEFTYPVKVEKGAVIRGKVTLNGAVAKNARVYVDYSASEATPSAYVVKTDMAALEDYTDENGHYEIKGLPMANNEFVNLHVTMAANVTVNGAARSVQIIDRAATADFFLNSFDGPLINNVYGFPLSVERIKKLPDNKLEVTGIVDLSKNNSAFTWLNPDTKLRISNIIFDGANNYQPVDVVPLDALKELKMKYLDQYNVLLERISGSTLGIQPGSKGGTVYARVSIADNSFNFPASYLNFTQTDPLKPGFNKPIQFYFSELGASSRVPNKTQISAIYSGPKENTRYYLSDKAGESLGFSFIGFKTTANAKNSYIGEDRKIHLAINFKGTVPNSTPGAVDIDINDLVLDGNKIYPAKQTDPLIVNLQTWKLEVRDWELNVEKGGIYSSNSIIKTGLVDIPVRTFNLRNDMCVIEGFDVSQL